MKKILLLLTSIVWVAIANSQDTAKHTVIAQVATPALLPPPGGGGSEPIGGSTSVVAGQTYTYSFPYAGTNQWSISGGSFVNGSVGISVSVIWTQAGTGTISVNNTTANTYGSLTVTIASPPLGGGSISPSSQIVNYGSSATALTYSGATGGNGTAVTYQWQESFDDVTWTNLSGTTGTSYNPGVLDETVFFRVAATQGGSTVYSAAASVSSTATVASPVMVSSTDNDGTSNVSLSNTVGTSNGSAGVNSLGGSSYTIPFDVLPGTAGMQPNVGLVYNSQGGVGIAGWGWNLTGISSITRAGKNTYYNGYTAPVAYSDSDAFVLDGQRLFATSGTNGSDGTIYGQENEDFSQIVSHGAMSLS